jgi:hypothetical protein
MYEKFTELVNFFFKVLSPFRRTLGGVVTVCRKKINAGNVASVYWQWCAVKESEFSRFGVKKEREELSLKFFSF